MVLIFLQSSGYVQVLKNVVSGKRLNAPKIAINGEVMIRLNHDPILFFLR